MSGSGPTGSGDRLIKDEGSCNRGRGGYSLRRREGSTNLLQGTQVNTEAQQVASMMALPVPSLSPQLPVERSTSSPSLALRAEGLQLTPPPVEPMVFPGQRPPTPQVPHSTMGPPQMVVIEPMDVSPPPPRAGTRRPLTADPGAKPPCSPEKRKK